MAIQDELQGSSALLTRALNEDVRSSGIQLGMGMFVAAGLWVAIIAALNRFLPGAPGLAMFQNILLADLALVYFVVVPYFAGAITEEREQGTLGLLKLSGISPLGLLLGKSVSRLIGVCLGLILQVPFILFAVTLGGVTYYQIGAAMTGLLAFLFLLNNICLFASLCRPTTKEASGVVRSLLILWLVLPRLLFIPALILLSLGKFSPAFTSVGNLLQECVNWVVNLQFPVRLSTITSSTFDESWLSWQVLIDLAFGSLFFVVSRRRFEPLTFDIEPVAARPVQKKSKPLLPVRVTTKLTTATTTTAVTGTSERCSDHPFFWKEFHFRSGGWRGLRWQWTKSLLIYSAMGFVIILMSLIPALWMNASLFSLQRVIWTILPSLGGLITFFSGIGCLKSLVSSFHESFTEELRQKTYASLLLTPNDARRIAIATILGRLMGCLPPLLWSISGFLLTVATSPLTGRNDSGLPTVAGLLLMIPTLWIFFLFLLWLFYVGLWGDGIAINSGKWLATLLFIGFEILLFIGIQQAFWWWDSKSATSKLIASLCSVSCVGLLAGVTARFNRLIPDLMRNRMGD